MFIMVTVHKKKLRQLMNIILVLYPEDIVIPINDSMSSVQFVLHNPVDMNYADQSTPPMDVLATGGMIHKSHPEIPMYMIADTEKYLQDAFEKETDGNRFDPTGTATRGEVSAVLRRFVEIVIDSGTAQGFDVNDNSRYCLGKPSRLGGHAVWDLFP